MMCDYCNDDKKFLSMDVATEVFDPYTGYDEIQVIVDRGYLRLGYTDDMQCMDHSKNIKICFCPMCGEKL